MTKVCFVAPYAYSLFDPSTRFIFGGSEVRAWHFARALAARPGFEVSFVTFDHGQSDRRRFGAVTVYRHSGYRSFEAGVERPYHWQWWRVRWGDRLAAAFGPEPLTIGDHSVDRARVQVYRRIDADVYCGMGVSNLTAELAAFCHAADKRLVLLAGSDIDFSEDYRKGSDSVNSYGNVGDLCHFAINQADVVIAQTRHQADLLAERFGRSGTVIANPIDLPDGFSPPAAADRPPVVLWVGKSDRTKRPEIFLDLARKFPEVRFRAVVNRSHDDVHEAVLRDAPENVEIIERVSYPESEGLYRDARVLVNTSAFEGFPNTFLQAGKWGVPVLSLSVDPDGFIAKHDCGIVAGGDLDRLAEGLGTLWDDPDRHDACARNIRAHVARHHDLKDQVVRLEHVLRAEPSAELKDTG